MMNESERRSGGNAGSGMWILTFAIAGLALLLGVFGVFTPMAGSGTPTAPTKTVEVTLAEFKVTPASIDVQPGQQVKLVVTNHGTMDHDLKVGGKTGTQMLRPGTSETVTVGPFDASTQAWCTVPGHKQAGMVMDINVAGAASAAGGAVTAAATSGGGAKIDPNAMPKDGWTAYDPKLAPAPGGTIHDIEIHAIEKEIEVAPGVTQLMWTFDGKVPGTILRGKIGDLFNITLVNDGKMGHSIDFHASRVAWSDEMRTIAPGERLTYQFKSDYAGAFMYHCGTAPALHHIGNGMYGAIIIDPPELAPVDHEFVFVQSELYLGPNGKEGDLTKMLAEQDDAVVFNGYYNQYKFAPIRVEPNQRIRAWVIDDGPSENSAFHIVGTIFDTVWKEGTYLLRPDARHGGSQVLDLQPAQGGFVEFSLPETGFYPIVTHKFSNASRGAMGLFQAGDATMPAGAGH
jgi:nitrite reductase (NO-forming)